MCMEKTDWEKAMDFHGHSCPGLAVGYRVAQIALRELASRRAEDEELVAVVENDACGVDAIMVLTGCTLGKGNLLYRDFGKQVYTFGTRNGGKALRISVNGAVLHRQDPALMDLRKKVFGSTATAEEKEVFHKAQHERTHQVSHLPEEEFCKVENIDFEFPGKARIFPSVECAACGEYVMEPRARVKNGELVCIPCAGEYSRGW